MAVDNVARAIAVSALGGEGTRNHAELSNLEYGASGHTGFASSASLDSLEARTESVETKVAVIKTDGQGNEALFNDGTYKPVGGGGTNDHNVLTNRDMVNQHTISSVTGLQEGLDSKAAKTSFDSLNTQVQDTMKPKTDVIKLTGDGSNFLSDNGTYKPVGGGGTNDHSILINRDAAEQHPTSSITGLDAALLGKSNVGDSYIKSEADELLNKKANAYETYDGLDRLLSSGTYYNSDVQSGKQYPIEAIGHMCYVEVNQFKTIVEGKVALSCLQEVYVVDFLTDHFKINFKYSRYVLNFNDGEMLQVTDWTKHDLSTLSGYGIKNAYTKIETDDKFATKQYVDDVAGTSEISTSSIIYMNSGTTFIDTKPTTTSSLEFNLVGSTPTTKTLVYTFDVAGEISDLSWYQLNTYFSGMSTLFNTDYTFDVSMSAITSSGSTIISQAEYTNGFTTSTPSVSINMPNNKLTAPLPYAIGDYLEISISISKNSATTGTVTLNSGVDNIVTFIRNGGDVSSANVLDFDGTNVKTQAERNRLYSSEISKLADLIKTNTISVTINPSDWVGKKYTVLNPLIDTTSDYALSCGGIDTIGEPMFKAIEASCIWYNTPRTGEFDIVVTGAIPTISITLSLDITKRG